MVSPDLTIIICTYNRTHQLGKVIDSILKQSDEILNIGCEILIVDNNSFDNTKDVIHQYKNENSHSIKYVFEPRPGKSFALNRGIKEATAEQLVFTDDDVVLDSNWIKTVKEAFEEYPHICFGGKVVPVIEGNLPDWLDNNGTIFYGPLVKHDEGEKIREYDNTMRMPIGCNLFLRKEIFEKFGYYNTNLGHYTKNEHIGGEETELLTRIRKNGVPILYFPRAVVYHPIDRDRLKRSYFRKFYWGNGRGFARWCEQPKDCVRYLNIPRYIVPKALGELSKAIYLALRKKKPKSFLHEMRFLFYLAMAYEYYLSGE